MAGDEQRAKLVIGIELDQRQARKATDDLRSAIQGGVTGAELPPLTGTDYGPELGPRGGGATSSLQPIVNMFREELGLAGKELGRAVGAFVSDLTNARRQRQRTDRLFSEAARREELGPMYQTNEPGIQRLRMSIQRSLGGLEAFADLGADARQVGRQLGYQAAKGQYVRSEVAARDRSDPQATILANSTRAGQRNARDLQLLYETVQRGLLPAAAAAETMRTVERNDPSGALRQQVDAKLAQEEEARLRRTTNQQLREETQAARTRGAARQGMTPEELQLRSTEGSTERSASRLNAREQVNANRAISSWIDVDRENARYAKQVARLADALVGQEVKDPRQARQLTNELVAEEPDALDAAWRRRAEAEDKAARAAERTAAAEQRAAEAAEKRAARQAQTDRKAELFRRSTRGTVFEGPDAQANVEGITQRAASDSRVAKAVALTRVEALEGTVRAAEETLRLEEDVRRRYEHLARVVAQSPDRIHDLPQVQEAINRYDPAIMREAQYNAQRGRLKEFFHSDAPMRDKVDAVFRQAPPGEQRQRPGNFFGGVMEGFVGDEGRLDKTIGQALKFSVVYGGLYRLQSMVTAGFAAAAGGAADYEEALIALTLASTQTTDANERMAEAASRAGTALGVGPAVGVQASARAFGLYDLNNPNVSDFERQQIAGQSRDVGIRISQVTGQPVDQVQQQIAGLIRSFNLPAMAQSQVEDMATVVARQSGQSQGDVLSATTQLGTAAKAAGYDAAETMAIVAQLATTTGQTADAVAGQLSQIFSKADDPATLARLASVGVNVTGTTQREQLGQLAGMNLDQATLNQVVQIFGRGRSGQALSILLGQNERVQTLAGQARNAKPGEGQEAYEASMQSLRKQLMLFGGYLQEAANGLAQAGLFGAVEHLIFGLVKLAQIVDHVVDVYNELPGPVKTAIQWFLEVALALKLLDAAVKWRAAREAGGGIGDLLGGLGGRGKGAGGLGGILGRRGAPTTAALGLADDAVIAGTQVAKTGRFAALAGRGGALAGGALGLGLEVLTGPIGILAFAALEFKNAVDSFHEQAQTTRGALADAQLSGGGASNSAEMLEAANKFEAAAKAAQAQQEISFSNFLRIGPAMWTNRFHGTEASNTEETSLRRAAEERQRAKDHDAAVARATADNPVNAFQNFSPENITLALQTLTTRGLDAQQQFEALIHAMDLMTASASAAATAVHGAVGPADIAFSIGKGGGEVFTRKVGAAAGGALAGFRNELNKTIDAAEDTDPMTQKGVVGLWGDANPVSPQLKGGQQNTPTGNSATYGYSKWLQVTQGIRKEDAALLKDLDETKVSDDAKKAAADYLKSIGKDPTGKDVTLTGRQSEKLKGAVEASLRADIPGYDQLSGPAKAGLTQKLGGGYAKAIGLAENKTYNLESLQELLDKGMQLARSGADLTGVLARDSLAGPRQYLRNVDDLRAEALAAARTIVDPDDRQAAINGVRAATQAQRIQGVDAMTQAQFGRYDLQATYGASFLAPDQQRERSELALHALDQKLQTPVLSGKQITDLQNLLDTAPLTAAQRAEVEAQLASSSLSPEERTKLVAQRNELTKQMEAQDRAGLNATKLAQLSFDDRGRYTGATQREVLDEQMRQAKAEVKRTAGFDDRDPARAAALTQLAAASQGSAQRDLEDRSNRRLLGVAPGYDLDNTKAQLANAQDALSNARATGADELALKLQIKQLKYDIAMGDLKFAQATAVTDSTDPLMAARKRLDDLREQQRKEPNANAKKALQPQIDQAEGSLALVGFQEQSRQIDDAVDLGRMTQAQALAARRAEASMIDAKIAAMKAAGDVEGLYALERYATDLRKNIKTATESFQGQFNIGDIQMPTVYEIRRSLGVEGVNARGGGDNVTNHVQINGADFSLVVSYLNSILGAAPTRAATPRRVASL